jgi:hypothetical protein
MRATTAASDFSVANLLLHDTDGWGLTMNSTWFVHDDGCWSCIKL